MSGGSAAIRGRGACNRDYRVQRKALLLDYCIMRGSLAKALLILRVTRVKVMGESTGGKYNWDALLKEYLVTNMTKTEFAESKGINPSYLRRFTQDWPKHTKDGAVTVTKVTEKVKASKPKTIKEKVVTVPAVVNDKIKKDRGLTEKEKFFCHNYVNVFKFDVLNSYMAAYNCNRETARGECYKAMNKPLIRAEIKRLKKIKYKSVMIDQSDLVEKHMRIAFADISRFVEFGRVEVPVIGMRGPVTSVKLVKDPTTGEEKAVSVPVTRIVNDVRFKEIADVDSDLVQEVKVGKDGASLKLYSATESMEWLEKWFGWHPMDRHRREYDRKRLELEEKSMAQKGKTGALVAEAIASAGAQVQTLAGLLNNPGGNRSIEEFEK
jgi:phage terminase small subunit